MPSKKVGKKVAKKKPNVYSKDFKMVAVGEFYLIGSYRGAAKVVGVDHSQIRDWVQSQEGQGWLVKLREAKEEEFRTTYTEIVMNSTAELLDRIENGNVRTKMTNGGELQTWREPMTAHDLTYASGIYIDKLRVSNNLPTRISQTGDNNKTLLEQFQNIAESMQEKNVNVVAEKKLN